jgi:dTDP-4-dehydrorhamnose reductase
MDSLVIGASGQVGQFIYKQLSSYGRDVVGTCHTRCRDPYLPFRLDDVALPEFIRTSRPKTIYLCASLTNVDWIEDNRKVSFSINVDGTVAICHAAKDAGSKLIFLSSEYVFDGVAGPYDEHRLVHPINVLGSDKLAAESFIQAILPNKQFLIARTTWVYSYEGPGGKNFAQRVVETLSDKIEIKVPYDQYSTPTYAPDLANILITLAARSTNGIVHIAGHGWMSKAEWADQIARIFNLDTHLLKPVATYELGQIAKRPLWAGLESTVIDPLPGVYKSLRDMKKMMGLA